MNEQQARKRARREREFYAHLASYLIVNTFLLTLNMVTWEGNLWFVFPLLGWGVGVASHAASVFGLPGRAHDWEDRRVRELMGAEGSADRLRSLVDEELDRRAPRTRDGGDPATEAARLRQRIEHLEAIVTSRDWDAVEGNAPPPTTERALTLPDESDEETPEQRAERLARRVR
jgi:hypothetical protein